MPKTAELGDTSFLLLAELSFPEIQEVLKEGAVALWPIGSTEAHGPHLPLDTDVVIARECCRRASPLIRAQSQILAVTLPPLSLTVTDFLAPFPGTLSLSKRSVVDYVAEGAAAAARQGFLAVCLVNGHLEPAHRFALRDAVHEANQKSPAPVGLADPADRRFASALTEEFKSGSCHAGQYETSLMLAAAPERVRLASAKSLPPRPIPILERIQGGARDLLAAGGEGAYAGDPAAATREEGEASFATLAKMVAEVVRELLASRGPSK